MLAEILTIGDEILIGQIINTNTAWIGERLTLAGVDVGRMVTLGDDEAGIREELDAAFATADLVIITGGLGPTHDDVTKKAVADYFGVGFYFDEAVFEMVKERFRKRGREMPARNRDQALVPEGFEALPNSHGTAPGLWYVFEREGKEKILAVLPGVPHEMKGLMTDEVMPRLGKMRGLRIIRHKTLLTTGIGESHLVEEIGPLDGWLSSTTRLAFLPSTNGVRLRITALGDQREEVEARLASFEMFLRERAGRYLYGENEATLEAAVGEMLAERGLRIALGESCTGGHILNRLTNTPGSSRYVAGGVIAYCNDVKVSVLGVSRDALEAEGAVSETVAREMARGARERLHADIGLSTTGVAGPDGGTPEKPVGTVWLGYADGTRDFAIRLQLVSDRILNKELSSTAALDLVRRMLLRET